MGEHQVGRATVVIGLALIVAACSPSIPANSGSTAQNTAASSALVAPISPAASKPAPSPTAAPTPAPIVIAAAPLEPALKQLWQVGGPKPPKDGGCCVTVAPDGKIWVAAMHDSTFWIIDSNGKYLESWGQSGDGDGQFNFVVKTDGFGAIAFDPDGTFYVADTGNHRIQKFDNDRQFVKAWGEFGTDDGQFATPSIVVSDGRGHVYVQDLDRLDVQEFTSDGAFIRTLASGAHVYFIATDVQGHLYVDDDSMIRIFDAEGMQLPSMDLSSAGAKASGMAFDAEGHLYVATVSSYSTPIQTKAIYEIDASGAVLHAWPGKADAVALDPNGGALYSSFFVDPFIRKLALPTP